MNLSSMTVPQLREIAAELYVNGRTKMRKAELIDAIEAHRQAEQDRAAERDDYLKMNDAERAQAVAEMNERNRYKGDDEVNLSGMATMLGRDIFGTVEEQAAYIEEGIEADIDAGTYTPVNEVAILRDAPGTAIVTAAFDGRTVGGSIVRRGKRLVLMSGCGTITGTSFEKVAKRFAARLGFRADVIDVAKSF
jgi:hypothetical protein